MFAVYSCLREAHDQWLLLLAAAVCVTGVYASFSISRHAGSIEDRSRNLWSLVAITSAGCTAWATHMIALLAFRPGMEAAFDPVATGLSLLLAITGIGASVGLVIGVRSGPRRLAAGLSLGISIALLHYLGQSAYLVTGKANWNSGLVALSLILSLPLFALAIVIAGARGKMVRQLAAPLLVAAIALLHFTGMSALRLEFDPRIALPDSSLPAQVIAPIVASVSAGLVLLAFVGMRFTLAARAQLLRDQLRFKQLADLAVEGLVICEDRLISAANSSLVDLSGFSNDALAGKPISSLLPDIALFDVAEQEEQDAELCSAGGERIPVRILRKTVRVGNREQLVIAVRDQRERLRTEHKIKALAFSDSLTGLANRLSFNDLLEGKCRRGAPFALLLLDLDRFKSVNDTLGHTTGDELLKRVANRILGCNDNIEAVARLGGDEFAVLVKSAEAAGSVCEAIIDLASRPFLIDGSVIEIAASIGIAVAPQDGSDPATLSRHADLALYASKNGGGSIYCYFAKEMSDRANARRELELDLRRALTREEFEVFYQPQVDPLSGTFQGAEALVRWHHPNRGMISPADFIPLAEEIGLIGSLGEWVLRTACAEAMNWPRSATVAVNLSAVQLRDSGLAQTVARILEETGLPASRLELEITESALLQDEATTYSILYALRDMGIRISMDDFGTGYSSLSYLRRFPFNKIKIDQSFVRQVPEDQDAVAIVQAITSLAAKLRMTVTVEGVETPEQRAFTVSEGCDQIQGYLISRPVERKAIRNFFDQAAKAVA